MSMRKLTGEECAQAAREELDNAADSDGPERRDEANRAHCTATAQVFATLALVEAVNDVARTLIALKDEAS